MSPAKVDVRALTHGVPSGKHEPVGDVFRGWNDRINEVWLHNAAVRKSAPRGQVRFVRKTAKDMPLPSDLDSSFSYGLPTREIDIHADPLYRSNAIIRMRIEAQERAKQREEVRRENERTLPKKNPARPTAASKGHEKHAPGLPPLAETFKMKRFTQFEHGKVDTLNRKPN
jgi:hypothetical protein